MALILTMVLVQMIFRLPLDLLYRGLIGIAYIFAVNPIYVLIEKITGEAGKKKINKVVFWSVSFAVVFLTLTVDVV
ncbi:hypothetical protein [Mesobacillus foraminis]|uniref:Uncharacterized protein n=1 Tax=Mesobacillus foraminis TaxID=279826 RepID=A0A4R2BE41_9BACI|nr:hypothetical protein [Mesobacillus foraminis]TCN25201.1 hypothetical protein EV146_106406 [Mesobacillus foraminis]